MAKARGGRNGEGCKAPPARCDHLLSWGVARAENTTPACDVQSILPGAPVAGPLHDLPTLAGRSEPAARLAPIPEGLTLDENMDLGRVRRQHHLTPAHVAMHTR